MNQTESPDNYLSSNLCYSTVDVLIIVIDVLILEIILVAIYRCFKQYAIIVEGRSRERMRQRSSGSVGYQENINLDVLPDSGVMNMGNLTKTEENVENASLSGNCDYSSVPSDLMENWDSRTESGDEDGIKGRFFRFRNPSHDTPTIVFHSDYDLNSLTQHVAEQNVVEIVDKTSELLGLLGSISTAGAVGTDSGEN